MSFQNLNLLLMSEASTGKRILILGSEGFIGRHLVNYFLHRGFNVMGCDLMEKSFNEGLSYNKVSGHSPDWEMVFSSCLPDICINAAGNGNVPYSVQHPVLDFEANTRDTINLLDVVRTTLLPCKYLHISSAAVYGNPPSLPVTEDMPLRPLSPYGWHKLMSEMICREYHELYGLRVAILRPFSVYGNGLRKQLLWDVCKKLQDQETITLYGTGRESRDFIHIDDLCSLIGRLISQGGFEADLYNVGNGTQIYIDEIVSLLRQNFNSNKSIRFSGEYRTGDPMNWQADIRRIRALGYAPEVSLEKGIRDYVSYFKEWVAKTTG